MDQNKISKDFQLSEDDYMAFNKIACKKIGSHSLIIAVATIIIGVIALYQIQALAEEIISAGMLEKIPVYVRNIVMPLLPIVAVFFVVSILYKFFMKASKFSYVLPEGSFMRPKTVTIDEIGIADETELSMSCIKWQGILRIENEPALILFYVDRMSAYVVPKHGFTTPDEAEAFYKQAVMLWENARNKGQTKNPWARSVAFVNPSIPEQAQ